jgi:hypothetical protein
MRATERCRRGKLGYAPTVSFGFDLRCSGVSAAAPARAVGDGSAAVTPARWLIVDAAAQTCEPVSTSGGEPLIWPGLQGAVVQARLAEW